MQATTNTFLSASKYMGLSGHLLKQMKKKGNNAKTGNAFSRLMISNLELNNEISLEAGRFSLNPAGSIFLPFEVTDHSIYGYWQLQVQYRF